MKRPRIGPYLRILRQLAPIIRAVLLQEKHAVTVTIALDRPPSNPRAWGVSSWSLR